MTHFQEQLASVPAVPEPHWYAAFSAVLSLFCGVGAWGSDHRRQVKLHNCTHKMAEKEQELKRFWFEPKSLVISLHE